MDILIYTALVLGLTQVVKKVGLKSKFAPLVSLLISFVILFAYAMTSGTVMNWSAIENSIIVGLSASGLWSGAKATFSK